MYDLHQHYYVNYCKYYFALLIGIRLEYLSFFYSRHVFKISIGIGVVFRVDCGENTAISCMCHFLLTCYHEPTGASPIQKCIIP